MTKSENTISTFNFAGAELRVVTIKGEPWFVGSQVCNILGLLEHPNGGYSNHYRKIATDERKVTPMSEVWVKRRGQTSLIAESGLYKLIMRSDKPEAVKFQDWVTREVLPAIRKTGGYLLNEEERDTASADDRQAMPLPEVISQATQAVTYRTPSLMP